MSSRRYFTIQLKSSVFCKLRDPPDHIVAHDGRYKCINHAAKSFNKLCHFYKSDQLTDITLIAGDTIINTHKLVLASVSEYFSTMFNSDLLESRAKEVELHDVNGEALNDLVTFAYTGGIELKEDSVENILAAAVFLRFGDVIKACTMFLRKQLDPNNCIGIAMFAESRNCYELRDAAVSFTEEHFIDVMASQEFLMMPADELAKFLSSDDVNVPSEELIYKGVMAWIEHDLENRSQHLKKLLGLVKLPLLSPAFLVDEVVPKVGQGGESLIIEALKYHAVPERRTKLPANRVTPRKSTVGQLFSVAGCVRVEDMVNWSSTIEAYSPRHNSWSHVTSLPHRRLQSGVAALGQKLFVVGGRDGLKTLNSIDFLDLDAKLWLSITPMSTCRHGLGVTTMEPNGPLYAVGGHDGWSYLNTVERWDPDTGEWSYIKSMNSPRSTVGVAILYNRLYVVGGRDGIACLKSIEAYDPLSDKWTSCTPMSKRRGGVAVAVLDGYLYALGGHDVPTCNSAARFSCVERYDPKMDRWQNVCSMSVGRDGIGAGILGNRIFAVGGYDGESYLKVVEAYDLNTDTWSQMAPLNVGRAGSCVVSIKKD
ncbi:kelch-like protein 5 isoform X2 [Halyomorpha halys]|uniref:kelch-like protein 5 isoform X2 n=1 Tax=Halyomorpha halys TaxID=286706 RepID=UPI0006D51BC2